MHGRLTIMSGNQKQFLFRVLETVYLILDSHDALVNAGLGSRLFETVCNRERTESKLLLPGMLSNKNCV